MKTKLRNRVKNEMLTLELTERPGIKLCLYKILPNSICIELNLGSARTPSLLLSNGYESTQHAEDYSISLASIASL